jgi:peptidoglycan/xylan/chitin deacetylase (PgdA/CDA1 family)
MNPMKTLAKSALCALYKYSGAARVHESLSRRRFPSILLFHRVTDQIPADGLTVGTRRFVRICKMLRRRFRVVPLAEMMRLVQERQPFPPRTVAITFDDCYRDNLFAARVLADHGLPACFFIPTAFVGTDHVFPWDQGLPRMANLSWDEIREMAGLGHEIGSHTCTHPDMAEVALEQARQELVESKKVLENQLGRPVRWFAYPFGNMDNFRPDRLPLVTAAGYECCLAAVGGFIYPERSYPILPRVPVPEFHSVLNLELYLRGSLSWFYERKRRARSRSVAEQQIEHPAPPGVGQ